MPGKEQSDIFTTLVIADSQCSRRNGSKIKQVDKDLHANRTDAPSRYDKELALLRLRIAFPGVLAVLIQCALRFVCLLKGYDGFFKMWRHSNKFRQLIINHFTSAAEIMLLSAHYHNAALLKV